ncbi:hypothetical protein J6590_021212 [Homalodisca vitripennis]|nr:hypothetical protein J6590_021212 [Homalodisca vitripennis]
MGTDEDRISIAAPYSRLGDLRRFLRNLVSQCRIGRGVYPPQKSYPQYRIGEGNPERCSLVYWEQQFVVDVHLYPPNSSLYFCSLWAFTEDMRSLF